MITVGWVCNLESDVELAEPAHFVPSRRLLQQTEAMADRLLAMANDASPHVRHVRLAPGQEPTICQAWCPTDRARELAGTAGYGLPPGPSMQVLRQANHRAFGAALGYLLDGAGFATTVEQVEQRLRSGSPAGGWLLKRPLGFSGRGRKRLVADATERDWRWIAASMEQYGSGLMVEPFVPIEQEFSLHSWLAADGSRLAGEPTVLVTDEHGAWNRSEAGAALSPPEREQLHAAHEKAACALHEIGYHGPFATDAFRYRGADGRLRLQPLSELNARYSMGFFVGMADVLDEWARRIVG